MANFNKAFNFRGGFQVDEDTFLVRGSNVGIGSSVPSERLDVDGVVKARGLIIDSTDVVAITTAYVGVVSATEVQSGVFTGTPENGGIATYYGDGSQLLNLPTSQWLDIDVGLGFTSIYAAGNVGVDTVDPRYKFQVGGVPFKTKTGPLLQAQDGVGVEDGNIYFSGIASARFKPGLEKQGFVGYGSYITTLNASELTTGDIPSYAYGDLIITEEIIAPKLTGIASTAIGVTTDAQLSFDTAVANELRAINRFISTEGYVQVGTDENVSYVGDIEVVKSSGDSKIYAISATGESLIMVGEERQTGSNRQFGGIRKGTFSSEPLTGDIDLDLVNYDVGNLNFYLHSGSGGQGATNGKFRWIYGQRDVVVMDLDRDGRLTLPTNAVITDNLLSVGGNASVEGKLTSNELSVTGVSSFTSDATFYGNVISDSITISGVVTFVGVDTDELLVGTDPDNAGTGAKLTPVTTNLHNVLTVTQATSTTEITGSLDVTSVNATNVGVTNLTVTSGISGPSSFNVTSAGTVNAPNLNVSGTSNLNNIIGLGSITAGSIYGSVLDIDTAVVGGLNVSGDISVDNIVATGDITGVDGAFTNVNTTNIVANDIDVNTLDADTLNVGTKIVGTASTVVVDQALQVNGDLYATGKVTSDLGKFGIGYNGTLGKDLELQISVSGSDLRLEVIGVGFVELTLGT